MIRKLSLIVLLALSLLTIFGCSVILEDDRVTETLHVITPAGRPEDAQIEISTFEELKDAIINMIYDHEPGGRIIVSYDTEHLQEDVDRAIYEIMENHPLGAFAVSEIIGSATKIVTFFEVDISITYHRTRYQINSIINVSDIYEVKDILLETMNEYRDEVVFRTDLQLTNNEILNYISDIYYQNPRSIVIHPAVAVEMFPKDGEDRVFSVSFNFGQTQGIMRTHLAGLSQAIQSQIDVVEGDTQAEQLLSLADNLSAIASFDDATARTLSAHGIQNLTATAFGALLTGRAIGEGFAMAYKALGDTLGIDIRVVLGTLDGRYHAWNLVNINGYYYHVDVSMAELLGMEEVFFRSDQGFRALGYVWDVIRTPRAGGPLTYIYIAGIVDDDYNNGYDENYESAQPPISGPPTNVILPPIAQPPEPKEPDDTTYEPDDPIDKLPPDDDLGEDEIKPEEPDEDPDEDETQEPSETPSD